jgi:hypothetical protein
MMKLWQFCRAVLFELLLGLLVVADGAKVAQSLLLRRVAEKLICKPLPLTISVLSEFRARGLQDTVQ